MAQPMCTVAALVRTARSLLPVPGFTSFAERGVKIDTPVDWAWAEFLLEKGLVGIEPFRCAMSRTACARVRVCWSLSRTATIRSAQASLRRATVDEGPHTREELLARIGGRCRVIRFAHRSTRRIEAGRQLSVIACAATGIDHIDERAAAAQGIALLSLRGETHSCAGFTSASPSRLGLVARADASHPGGR